MFKKKLSRNQRRGANAIEFALTLPVFMGITMGIIDFGYYFAAQAVLDAAVLEGTREGAITDPASGADLEAIGEARMHEIASLICGSDCSYNCNDQTVQYSSGGETHDIRELECEVTWTITPLVGFSPIPPVVSSKGRQLLEWQRNGS